MQAFSPSAFAFCGIACVLALPGSPRADQTPAPPRVSVATDTRDLNKDGKPDTLAVVLTKGQRYVDELWCGAGDKHEGHFVLSIQFAGQAKREQDLNALVGSAADEIWFMARPWRIVFQDYNHDGQLDFNLGQYFSCNGWTYTLLTLTPSGEVARLPIDGLDGGLFINDTANSTNKIALTASGFAYSQYDNSVGKERRIEYRWNAARQRFVR